MFEIMPQKIQLREYECISEHKYTSSTFGGRGGDFCNYFFFINQQ